MPKINLNIGDIVEFKHWIPNKNLRSNDLFIENGVIIAKSEKFDFDWIVKGYSIDEPIHLKETWITKLN